MAGGRKGDVGEGGSGGQVVCGGLGDGGCVMRCGRTWWRGVVIGDCGKQDRW